MSSRAKDGSNSRFILISPASRESHPTFSRLGIRRPFMTLTQLILAELEREAPRTRRALEQVPLDRDDWTPHPKSMPLGRLAGLVASMPSWINLIIDQPELNLTPPAGQGTYQQPATDKLVAAHDG